MDDDLTRCWQSCQADWLSQVERRSGALNTRRAYAADVREFFEFSRREPAAISTAQAEAWAQELTRRGLAPATINRKLSSLSSLYRFAAEYPVAGQDRLWPHVNPFGARALRNPHPSGPVDFPSSDQIADLLAVIPTSTPTGLRNLAIIAGLVSTTRRISEWIGLRAGDVEHDGGYHMFTYRCKGGQVKQQQLSGRIWGFIAGYCERAGRLPLAADAYLFVALSDNGERLNHASGGPLNPGYVARLIKRYGAAAEIPDERLYPHALRHAGTQLRRENDADILDLQSVLGHESPKTTMGYLRRLDRPQDPQVNSIETVLPKHLRRGEAR